MASPLSIQRQIQNAAAKAGQPVSGDLQQLAQLISQLPAAEQSAYVASIAQNIQNGQIGSLTQAVLDQMAQQVQPQVQAQATSTTAAAPQSTAPAPTPQTATLTGATVTPPTLNPASAASAPAAGGSAISGTSAGTAGGAQTPGVLSGSSDLTQQYLNEYQQGGAGPGQASQGGVVTPGANVAPWQPQVPGGAAGDVGAVMGTSQTLQYLAGYLGVSPQQVQSGYQSYVAQLQASAGGGPGQAGRANNVTPVTPPTIEQWVAGQVSSIEGRYEPILNAYEQSWEQTNQGPMPPELRQQLRQQLQNMPPAEQQALDSTLSQYLLDWNAAQATTDPGQRAQEMQTALSVVRGNLPFLDAVVNNYQAAHPSSAVESNYAAQQKTSFIQTYVQNTGRWPSQAEIDKYGTLPSVEQGQYIDNAQVEGLPMTVAAYQSTLSMLNAGGGGSGATSWQQAFGKDPTPQQVYDLSHMNAQDVRSYIDNSPSKEIPGMTIGVYGNLQQVGADVSTKLFGTSDSSQLIQMFHEANQKT